MNTLRCFYKVTALAILLFVTLILMNCNQDKTDDNGLQKENCGDGSGYPVIFCRQVDYYDYGYGVPGEDFLKVTCLVGPEEATVSNCQNGTYYCAGTYKLSSFDQGKIDIGWGGTVYFEDPTYECDIYKGEGTFTVAITKKSGGEGNIQLSMSSSSYWMFSTGLINLDCYHIEPPTDLTALYDTELHQVNLLWNDNSDNEDVFQVHRALTDVGDFSLLIELDKNVCTYIDAAIDIGKTYYYYITAKNDQESSSSNTVAVNTSIITVTDIDGNVYKGIDIFGDIWMTENLKTTHYADGTPLVDGSDITVFDLYDTTKYWFVYDNNPMNKETFGLLYTWHAAMNGAPGSEADPSGVQGVCPDGWHMPSKSEWNALIVNAGGSDIAGGKLKGTGTIEAGTGLWNSPNTGATDEYGFNAIPGGGRSDMWPPYFGELGYLALFWSATSDGNTFAYVMSLNTDNTKAVFDYNLMRMHRGHSVRCIKNE